MLKFLIFSASLFLFLGSGQVAAQNYNADDNVMLSGEDLKHLYSDFNFDEYTLDLKRFLEVYNDPNEDFILLDLRSLQDYKREHIQGAIHFGSDIDEAKIKAIVPSKATKILVYCSNSITPTRTISLTDISAPQFHALGYMNTYALGRVWTEAQGARIEDVIPMVSGQ